MDALKYNHKIVPDEEVADETKEEKKSEQGKGEEGKEERKGEEEEETEEEDIVVDAKEVKKTKDQIITEAESWWKNGFGAYILKKAEAYKKKTEEAQLRTIKESEKEINQFLTEKFPEKKSNNAKIAKYMSALKKQATPKEYQDEEDRQSINQLRYVIGTRNTNVPTNKPKGWKIPRSSFLDNSAGIDICFQYNHFEGMDSNGKMFHGLTNEWVDETFEPVFVLLVKWAGIISAREETGNLGVWVEIPKGNRKIKTVDNRDSLSGIKIPMRLTTNVKTHYCQLNKNYCLGFAIAAGLHYMGFERKARLFSTKSYHLQLLLPNQAIKEIKKIMKYLLPSIASTKQFNIRRKSGGKNTKSIEDILNNKDSKLKLVIPKGKDTDTTHAITIVDDLIFDPRFDHAFKLQMDSLDFITGVKGIDSIDSIIVFDATSDKKYKYIEREQKENW